MIYDFIIVGNGILGSSLAWKLAEKLPDIKICILGPKERFGSASLASGAMLNVFAELEKDFDKCAALREKFNLGYESLKMWKKHHKDLENKSGKKIEISWGTNIINSASMTKFEDETFIFLKNFLKKKKYKKKNYLVNVNKIKGLYTQYWSRCLKSLEIEDGMIRSDQVLQSIDIINAKLKNVNCINDMLLNLQITNNDKIVTLKNKTKLKCKNIVFANGAYAQKFLDRIPKIKNSVPRLFFNSGCAIEISRNLERNKTINTKEVPTNVIRTMDRGNACGLHWIPFKTTNTYLGASSNLLSIPEKKPRSNSVGYLIQEASNMISSEIGKSCFAGIRYGFRPTSADTFPLLGETNVKGIWMLNGTKRDGFTSSPKIIELFVDQIEKKKNALPKIFKPSRNLISYYDKNTAIEKSFNSIFNKQNSHGMKLTDHNYYDEYRSEILKKINLIYNKHKIKKFGIHPELLDLYRLGVIKNKRSLN